MQLILASSSPRRQELLALLGVPFTCCPADIDETPLAEEDAKAYVERLAAEKARAVARHFADAVAPTWVLGSDTSVVVDGDILGKPLDEADALAMLQRLSNRTHQVMTAVCLVGPGETWTHTNITDVTFKALTYDEQVRYWHSGEPCDKAGAYGIQGRGARFVKGIVGSYHAVMGLPVDAVADGLEAVGFRLWQEN